MNLVSGGRVENDLLIAAPKQAVTEAAGQGERDSRDTRDINDSCRPALALGHRHVVVSFDFCCASVV